MHSAIFAQISTSLARALPLQRDQRYQGRALLLELKRHDMLHSIGPQYVSRLVTKQRVTTQHRLDVDINPTTN
jgi:hypothetical protein